MLRRRYERGPPKFVVSLGFTEANATALPVEDLLWKRWSTIAKDPREDDVGYLLLFHFYSLNPFRNGCGPVPRPSGMGSAGGETSALVLRKVSQVCRKRILRDPEGKRRGVK
jgi:hypothetical protein